MIIFFIVIGHNERLRVLKHDFQHSSQTIHNCFHEVLNGMMEFAKEIIVTTSFDPNPDILGNHKAMRRIFSGTVGALDGTLIHAVIPNDQQTCYRGRGECYQNVLGICDFNMIFTFVWAGWEGVAHDSRVLTEIAFDPDVEFPFPPPNKYYLCDAAYTNIRGFLVPFRNTRFWQADFNNRRPSTKQEKFNHAHARLRNVIERAFRVLKSRFPILKQMAPCPFPVQRDIVVACFAVHNFIRMEKIDDTLFAEYDNVASSDEEEEGDINENQLIREQHYRQQWRGGSRSAIYEYSTRSNCKSIRKI